MIAKQILAYRQKTPFDFILMLGDNIYGGGKPKYFKAEFEDPYKDLLAAGVKFYAVLGNHDVLEADYHVNYKDFNMGGKRYYNFVKGAKAQTTWLSSSRLTPIRKRQWIRHNSTGLLSVSASASTNHKSFAGARYLRFLLDTFEDDVSLALAAYNAGEGNVEKYDRRVPPFGETVKYVSQIRQCYEAVNSAPLQAAE